MLNSGWRLTFAAAIGVGVLLDASALLSVLFPHYGQICEAPAQGGQEHCATYDFTVYYVSQIGAGLDAHAGAVGAIATVFIAAFTVVLARVSRRQADLTQIAARAAEKSAAVSERALTDLERPYLFILDFNWLAIDQMRVGGLEPGIVYSVSNGGKLPAFITGVKLSIRINGTDPGEPADEPPIHELLTAPLVITGERRIVTQKFAVEDDSEGASRSQPLLSGEIARIPNGIDRVFAKIAIKYDGPITAGHETIACWEWHWGKMAFSQFGGDQHNKRT
jgi:hypothetical protein